MINLKAGLNYKYQKPEQKDAQSSISKRQTLTLNRFRDTTKRTF